MLCYHSWQLFYATLDNFSIAALCKLSIAALGKVAIAALGKFAVVALDKAVVLALEKFSAATLCILSVAILFVDTSHTYGRRIPYIPILRSGTVAFTTDHDIFGIFLLRRFLLLLFSV